MAQLIQWSTLYSSRLSSECRSSDDGRTQRKGKIQSMTCRCELCNAGYVAYLLTWVTMQTQAWAKRIQQRHHLFRMLTPALEPRHTRLILCTSAQEREPVKGAVIGQRYRSCAQASGVVRRSYQYAVNPLCTYLAKDFAYGWQGCSEGQLQVVVPSVSFLANDRAISGGSDFLNCQNRNLGLKMDVKREEDDYAPGSEIIR